MKKEPNLIFSYIEGIQNWIDEFCIFYGLTNEQ